MIWSDEAKLWLPSESVKMDRCWRFIQRNTGDLDKGISWVKKRSVAVQAGGHIGIFPNHLAKFFDTVATFEPDPVLYECLLLNRAENVKSVNAALHVRSEELSFRSSMSGTGAVTPDGDTLVWGIPLDSSGVTDVNFIHLDVEGHEVQALRGAVALIERCSPVIQLEILPRFKDQIYEYMDSIGYKVVCDACRDHIFTRGGK